MLQGIEQTFQSPQEEEGHQTGFGEEDGRCQRLPEEVIPEPGSSVGKKKWGTLGRRETPCEDTEEAAGPL